MQRALDFLEFIEAQEPAIIEAESALFGFRNKMRNAKRTIVRLGVAVLLVGAALYLVLAFPDDARRVVPREMPLRGCNLGLLISCCCPDRRR